jgi:hypothetical protein
VSIVASDIVTRFSTVSGSAGDTLAGTAAGSLGKYVSQTAWVDAATLFDDISGTENSTSVVDYRCIFVLNNHGSLTASSIKAYLSSEVSGGAAIAIAVDNIAASAKGGSSAQSATIANETTAPSGVGSFSSPTTDGTGLSLGDLAPGQVRAIWIRRTAQNSAALAADGVTLGFSLDTP